MDLAGCKQMVSPDLYYGDRVARLKPPFTKTAENNTLFHTCLEKLLRSLT